MKLTLVDVFGCDSLDFKVSIERREQLVVARAKNFRFAVVQRQFDFTYFTVVVVEVRERENTSS